MHKAHFLRLAPGLMRCSAMASITVLTLAWAASASAQIVSGDRGPYFSLLMTGSEPAGPKPTASTDLGGFSGLGLAGSVGYRWLPLRVELEYQGNSSGWIGGTEDEISIRALTLNAIVDLQLSKWFGMYFGAGFGRADVSADFSTCLQPSGCATNIEAHTSGSGSARQFQLGVTVTPGEGAGQLLIGFRRLTTGSLGLTYNQGQPFEVDNADADMTFVGFRTNF